MNDLTAILDAVAQGDPGAPDRLTMAVYDELRRLAIAKLRHEKPGQTLQPTALVHEAFLRLLGPDEEPVCWKSRRHYFAAASEAMRRILIESARRKGRLRHGGGRHRVELDHGDLLAFNPPDWLFDLDDALQRLAAESPDEAELVRLRYFAGLTIEQSAEAMGISPATAKRRWSYAKAWLYDALRETEDSTVEESGR